MPGIFKSKKQSKEAKRRFEHLMLMAKENPNRIFDLSSCELHAVPSSLFVQCRVFLSESLLLHTNMLKSLKDGGKMTELINLRVLDVHANNITQLPVDIGILKNLQVLNVESNRLSEFPASIGEMKKLQSLLARDNALTCLPQSIGTMSSLRSLDISGTNQVFYLPKTFCQLRTLEVLQLAKPHLMEYPPPLLAAEGLEAMQKFICKDCGVQYIPPSHAVLKVLDQTDSHSSSSSNVKENIENMTIKTTVELYEKQKEEKRKQHLAVERQMAEAQAQLAMLSTKDKETKQQDYMNMMKDFESMDKTIQQQQEKKERERKEMLDRLKQVEKDASKLVNDLLNDTEKARKNEAILEAMQQQRLQEEEYFRVTQEDIDKLRKQEAVAAMQSMFETDDQSNMAIQKYLAEQEQSRLLARQTMGEDSERIREHLMRQQSNQSDLLQQIITEEHLQREAFAILQFQRDAVQTRIFTQIGQLQDELARLTQMEMTRKKMKFEIEQETLHLARTELSDLLTQLLKEKDQREEVLHQRLVEMEQQRENDQVDFWLVQYQRLLDSKPEILVQKEQGLEDDVIEVLRRADAAHHVPSFARHKVTTYNMTTLTDRQIQSIGVFEVGLRKNILKEIENYVSQRKKLGTETPSPSVVPQSSTPTPKPERAAAVPTAPSDGDIENECVICMDRQSDCVFLPCGHVCSCFQCSGSLSTCPMCRAKIRQKVRMFRS